MSCSLSASGCVVAIRHGSPLHCHVLILILDQRRRVVGSEVLRSCREPLRSDLVLGYPPGPSLNGGGLVLKSNPS